MAIIEHKTIHAAARNIFLTQTALTHRLRTLEQELSTTLFIRTRKGMKLTAEGEVLHSYCQRIREIEGNVLAKLRGESLDVEIELTINSQSSIMRSRIIPALLPLLKNYPNLLFNFNRADEEDCQHALKSGQCDLAVLNSYQITRDMRFKPLAPEEYILVACHEWQDRPLEDILSKERIVDFNHKDTLTYTYLNKFNLAYDFRKGRHFANNPLHLAELVAAGVGFSVLVKEFAMPFIASNKLIVLNDNQIMNLYPFLVWYERPELPRYFSEIINAIN